MPKEELRASHGVDVWAGNVAGSAGGNFLTLDIIRYIENAYGEVSNAYGNSVWRRLCVDIVQLPDSRKSSLVSSKESSLSPPKQELRECGTFPVMTSCLSRRTVMWLSKNLRLFSFNSWSQYHWRRTVFFCAVSSCLCCSSVTVTWHK